MGGTYTRRKTKKSNPFLEKIKKVPPLCWAVGSAVLVGALVLIIILCQPKHKDSSVPRLTEPTGNYLFSGGMAVVQQDGKWGYVKENGVVVVAPQYDDAKAFQQNAMAPVMKDGKWGYINAEGQLVIDCNYEDAEGFSQGLAAVQFGGKWGFINESGMNVIQSKYEYAGPFQENGLALIRYNGFYGYINMAGEEVIAPVYDSGSAFSAEGRALVSQKGLYGYIDVSGTPVVEAKFSYLGPFYCGLAAAKFQDQFGYIDSTGEFVIQPQYDYAEAFSVDGVAKVTVSGKYMYINTAGQQITDAVFQKAETFRNGYAVVSKDGKQGLLKPDGSYAIEPGDYQFPKPVSEGLLIYRDSSGLYGYMDTSGNIVVAAQFDEAQSFRKDSFAAVQKDGLWGIIGRDGTWISQPQYQDIK